MAEEIEALREEIGVLHDRIERWVKVVEQIELRHEQATEWFREEMQAADDRTVAAEHAIVAVSVSLLRAFADTAGWHDDDISHFLALRAEELDALEATASRPEDSAAGRLKSLFEEAAVILRPPRPT